MSTEKDEPQVTHSPQSVLEKATRLAFRLGMDADAIRDLVGDTVRRLEHEEREIVAATTYSQSGASHLGDRSKSDVD